MSTDTKMFRRGPAVLQRSRNRQLQGLLERP